jgi:hypothetical protein
MAWLDPAIHVFARNGRKTWMPGTRPGMTTHELDDISKTNKQQEGKPPHGV